MEVPRSTPIHGTFLELGISPIQFEIEQRQLCYLRQILVKDEHGVKRIYGVLHLGHFWSTFGALSLVLMIVASFFPWTTFGPLLEYPI